MAETAKVNGKEFTWDQLVKKYGEDKARTQAPELDPKYQELIKSEGQAKGSADYSHQFIDPQNISEKGWAGLGSPEQIQEGLDYMSTHGTGLIGTGEHLEASIGNQIMGAGGSIGSATGTPGGGGGDPTGKGKGAGTTKPPPSNPYATAEEGLMNALIGQDQAAMAAVNPYISGANEPQYAGMAQQIGESFAGGGVQGQNPNTAGILNKDAAAYAAANNAGEAGIQNAMKGAGIANAVNLQTSPYQGILSALTSEAQYKTETGAGTPQLAAGYKSLPPGIQALYNAVGTGAAPGASTVGTTSNPNSTVTSPTTDVTGSGSNPTQ